MSMYVPPDIEVTLAPHVTLRVVPTSSLELTDWIYRAVRDAFVAGARAADPTLTPDELMELVNDWATFGPGSLYPGGPGHPQARRVQERSAHR